MNTWSPGDLDTWTGGVWDGAPPRRAGPLSTDTRTLPPGALFLALRGERFDGHAFVEAAERAGAAAAIVERPREALPQRPGLPLLRVADTRTALAALAAGWRARLAARVAGITGTVGKSSTKDMLAAILARRFRTHATAGNLNNDLGVPRTLLDAPPDTERMVVEMGMNRPGEIAALARLADPALGLITRVGAGHTEAFGTERAVAVEKASLFAALPAAGTAVTWRDQPWFPVLAEAAPGRLVTCGFHPGADWVGEAADPAAGTCRFRETASGVEIPVRLPRPGRHLLENAMLAAAAARELGAAPEDVAEGLAGWRPLAMRGDLREIGGVRFLDDAYNANPESMRAALDLLMATAPPERAWLVLGGMRELGALSETAHHELGRRVAENPWAGLVAVGHLGRGIAEGALAGGLPSPRVARAETPAAAAAWLAPRVRPGDTVLLKASRGERLERLLDAWPCSEATVAGPV